MSTTLASYTPPFWAENTGYSRGRDPLGIQNSSVAMYAKMLPGMTNVTDRIRYYGFYAWLLDAYHQQNDFKASATEQHQFIRRAELLLAFIVSINEPEQLGIVGSFYTRRFSTSLANYDIAKGADKKQGNTETYWQYSQGAFGQYYLGPLMNLRLVATQDHTRFYVRTDRGKKLADAYNETISPEQRTLFLSIVKNGLLLREDIPKLSAFSFAHDITSTSEWEFYWDMLMNEDFDFSPQGTPLTLRRQTLQLFLNNLRLHPQPEAWNRMPEWMYQTKGLKDTEQFNEASYGWYYYRLNEYVHYALEIVFWGFLNQLAARITPVPVESFLHEMVETIWLELADLLAFPLELSTTVAEATLLIDPSSHSSAQLIDQVYNAVKAHNASPRTMAQAALLLVVLLEENREELEELHRYAYQLQVLRPGNAIELLRELVEKAQQRSMPQFLTKLLSWIINDHLAIAFQKMGNGEKNVSKLLLEDNHISVTVPDLPEPSFTSPRLKTLRNFSRDLGLLDDQNQLTELAAQVLL